jgi:TolA-binding protein
MTLRTRTRQAHVRLQKAFCAIACISVLATSPAALAQETPVAPASAEDDAAAKDAEARRLYTNGVELYEEGRYEQAIIAFRSSYEMSGRHASLKNIANAQERLNDLEGAVATLNEYRVYAEASEKDSLTTRIRVLEERVAKEREVRTAAAQAAAEAAALAAANQAALAQQSAPPTTRSNPLKWVLLGGGGALATGFGATTYVTYANGQTAREDIDKSRYESQRTLNSVSGALTLVGGGLAVVGIALPATRNVSITPTGTGLNFAGRF